MTENEVINKIYGYLKNQNEHIIMENMTNDFAINYELELAMTGINAYRGYPRWSFGFMLLKIVILTKWIRN